MPSPEIVIMGLTQAGKPFRPSDWAERLAGVFSMMGEDRRMLYSAHVQPVLRAGVRCLAINSELERQSPSIYQFLMEFARANDLQITTGRRTIRD